MTLSMSRLLPLLVTLVAAMLVSTSSARAAYSSSECVTDYHACCGPNYDDACDIPHACENVDGFNNVIQYSGFALRNNYSEGAVWDADLVESNISSSGWDNLYTDKTGTAIEYLSMHGTCGDYPHGWGFCLSDANCQNAYGSTCVGGYCNLTWRCDTNSRTCSAYKPGNVSFDRKVVQCGSGNVFGDYTSITSQMRFGENTSWAGLGLNGDVNFLVLDTSCPFAAPFFVEMNSQIFKGLHIEMGFTTSPSSDTPDSAVRGQYFGWRVNASQPVAQAWEDVSRFDDPAGAGCPGECTIAMSCDTAKVNSDYRVTYETLTNTGDPPSAPGYCSWVLWCC